jgi:diacylglycerol kinase (ATP)
MVAQAVDRFTILRLIPKIMKGTHVNEPILRMLQARRVVLESDAPLIVEADGEVPYLETHHLELEILPKKLRIIV